MTSTAITPTTVSDLLTHTAGDGCSHHPMPRATVLVVDPTSRFTPLVAQLSADLDVRIADAELIRRGDCATAVDRLLAETVSCPCIVVVDLDWAPTESWNTLVELRRRLKNQACRVIVTASNAYLLPGSLSLCATSVPSSEEGFSCLGTSVADNVDLMMA